MVEIIQMTLMVIFTCTSAVFAWLSTKDAKRAEAAAQRAAHAAARAEATRRIILGRGPE